MITNQSISEIKKIFNSYDKDESGILSRNELNRFFRSMKTYFTNQELNEVMYIIDENNDGQVSFQEFIQHIFKDE